MGANGGDLFKTTLMGGYDKDEVAEGITRLKDEAYAEKTRFLNTIKEKDKAIAELKNKLVYKEEQAETLQQNIKEKYQSYIDNYESIARLVFDAQVRAENIIKDANDKSARMLEQAKAAAEKCVESVQKEVDERLLDGKKKYIAVQEELNVTVELMNQVQRRIMEACKAVHNIVSTMPESMQELEDEMDEEDPVLKLPETAADEEASLDEEDVATDSLEEDMNVQLSSVLKEE